MITLHKLVNSSAPGGVTFFALGGGGALRMGARAFAAAFLSNVLDDPGDKYGGGLEGVGGVAGGTPTWVRLVRAGGVGLQGRDEIWKYRNADQNSFTSQR